MRVNGQISSRLHVLFDKDDEAWNPPRDESEPVKSELPTGVEGWFFTGRSKED